MMLIALAVLAATPATLVQTIAAAKPGDTIKLVAGTYPAIEIRSRTWNPPLTVDASEAQIGGVYVTSTSGLTWRGGAIVGTSMKDGFPTGYGFHGGGNSSNLTVYGVRFSKLRMGVAMGNVNGLKVTGNWFSEMSADGINISMSRNVVIDRNACSEFVTSPGSHPDCIQLWSRPANPPTADIKVTNNSAIGAMQGIGLFDHVRGGVPDGGFDRITIRGNTVLNTYGMGIAVTNCRDCVVRDNDVNSLPNYMNRAQLNISGGSVVACGNVVPMVPRQGSAPCPR